MEGGQAVDEPGLLLLDGDPGVVLLGVNQGRVGALSIKSEFENLKLGLSRFNLETNCIRPTVSLTVLFVLSFGYGKKCTDPEEGKFDSYEKTHMLPYLKG